MRTAAIAPASVILSTAKDLHRRDSSPSARLRMTYAAIVLFATSVFAADAPQQVTVIRAARLIDGRGGATITPALVVVRGNKIESVGGAVPAGAQVIDLGDVTLLPGLID